jgi:hypothetical protein
MCFLFIATASFSAFYFTMLTRWVVDTAEYKFIARTKGHVSNLTVTIWISNFNVSNASLTTPSGIKTNPPDYLNENLSRVQIVFEDFNGGLAIIVFSNMRILAHIPAPTIPVGESLGRFIGPLPAVEGDLKNCSGFFSHFSISANTPLGKIDVYSYSIESVVADNQNKWDIDFPQSKDRTLAVSFWAFIFLSATISSVCITVTSFLRLKTIIQTFPVVTLFVASVMCFLYLFVGVGADLLSTANVDFASRLLLSFLSAFFHFDYHHLMNNLLYGFLIGGSLIEVWLFKFYGPKRYLWYLSPLPLSILFSLVSLLSPSFSVSTGSSLWCIGIAFALVAMILRERCRILDQASIWDVIALLLSGYLLVLSTWNNVVNGMVNYYSSKEWFSSVLHIFFALAYLGMLLAIPSVVRKIRASSASSKTRMLGSDANVQELTGPDV